MPSTNPSPNRDASVVTTRVVTAGPIFKPSPPDALTSGYQIDPTAYGGEADNPVPRGRWGTPVFSAGSQLALAQIGAPWPDQINSSVKRFTAYRPNSFREIFAMKVLGNYGGMTSTANFGYRHQEYPASDTYHGGQAGYPGPVPAASRPMWSNLLAIVYALRVLNPTAGGSLNDTTTPANYNSDIYSNPAEYVPAGTASLVFKGENVS
jgi:hypothetical protein